jgi:hypothetical protein
MLRFAIKNVTALHIIFDSFDYNFECRDMTETCEKIYCEGFILF